jgi:uncharacterized membrane protein
VSKIDTLLFLHVLGGSLVVGGAVGISVFSLAAIRRVRPSEVALLFNLGRVTEAMINVGAVLALAFGIWLVLEFDYSFGDAWIVAALALFALSAVLGTLGGVRYAGARRLAEKLAASNDEPTAELQARLEDLWALVLSWASGAAAVAILAMMIFKPGAG